MTNQNLSFRKGLAIGAVVGVVVAGVGLAHSAVGKKAWQGNDKWFQIGYVIGFQDAVRISKSTTPQGYLNQTYVMPIDAKFTVWREKINELYEDPTYDEIDVPRVMIKVGSILAKEKKYGTDPYRDPNHGLSRLKEYFDARKERQRKKQKALEEGGEAASSDGDKSETESNSETKPPDGEKPPEADDDAKQASKPSAEEDSKQE